MTFCIKIIGTVQGVPTPHDGRYVAAYDPAWHRPDGTYDGGFLMTTEDKDKALSFPNATEALECWRKPYGIREDGRPNRPLTAFSVEVVPL